MTIPLSNYINLPQSPNTTRFDGSNDFMTALATGATDQPYFFLACALYTHGTSGTIFRSGSGDIDISLSSGELSIDLSSPAGAKLVSETTLTTPFSADNWYHLMISADLSPVSQSNLISAILTNLSTGVKSTVINTISMNTGDIDWTDTNFNIGGYAGPTALANLSIANMFVTQEYLEATDANLQRRFVLGKTVLTPTSGSMFTGTSPLIWLPNAFGTFNVNEGTGADFTVTGTLTAGQAI